ncbi:MAG: carbon-nitrogen hydrolase family protein [Anaerolineae bacterium]|nr:carbon-nitrogen hydrolase family protein [Anaerolineae bacterium]
MKIGVVQMESLHGDINGNIARHAEFVRLAASHAVELLIFPELSLTQYDAPYAENVATSADDPRFDTLQTLADEHTMTLCAGIPLKAEGGNTISMLIFQPNKPLDLYSKQYLHDDELPFFVPGPVRSPISPIAAGMAFAICYEISVPQHARAAHDDGASIYIASVAKTPSGVERAHERLATISRDYDMTVFLSNCVGPCDGSIGGGKSAVWNAQGEVLAQMDDMHEGIIVYDPEVATVPAEVILISYSEIDLTDSKLLRVTYRDNITRDMQ